MPEMAVLVVSCDKYSDLWRPFFTLFWKRWPDCPYPVFLGSNYEAFSDDRVRSICVGPDRSWADNLLAMLDRIDAPSVLMFLDDFLLIRPVDTARVAAMLELAAENGVGCLRLHPHPSPSRPLRDYPGLGEIQRGDEYRVSTQIAIWDVKLLRSLAWAGFSAWDFELIGSLISDRLPGTYWGVFDPVIDYRHGVLRGKWMPSGLKICEDARAPVDLTARPALITEEMPDPEGKPRILLKHLPAFAIRYIRLWRGKRHVDRFLRESGLQNPLDR